MQFFQNLLNKKMLVNNRYGGRYNEGDYIQTTDGLFFAVKGSSHQNRFVVRILRYLPDLKGDRVLDGVKYRRVYDIGSTTDYLKETHPEYVDSFPG